MPGIKKTGKIVDPFSISQHRSVEVLIKGKDTTVSRVYVNNGQAWVALGSS